ncbi:5'-3' exoribonuclease 2 [Candida viswanathii]|uniref:5'-3' exoribonuclease n=1 Tax=Candida viswanathii TaxID=5486 RepID=A0A367Y1J4_9ASCO|nr:5'-3' exoribonuclease 2 [Candida viswanathii]
MGVPALFRWLSRKYPKIISPVIEEEEHEIGGARYEDPNPNGEIDNLYLDMNGIVHPCSHPEHKKAPETEDEMFLDIFTYTDRVLMMARPRKVLMIAVDGVAPRAKMNQQRARRFRAAQDAKLKSQQLEIEVKEREMRGEVIDDAIKGKKQWDSNAITPGTPFMDRLAEALRYWVAYKLANDPGWANLQVIISDATVPGEGEHKLMNFIRSQRSDPQYDPNTKHCIYGLDADLIFLGLATHEPHFRVLREDVFAKQEKKFTIRDQIAEAKSDGVKTKKEERKPFLWLHVSVLREYLQVELYAPRMPFPFQLERAIDDWVFLCFFAGNDFLPHLPSLDVRDNGIDTLVQCWKRSLSALKDYVTCDGKLNLESVEILMSNLATREDEIFQKRHAAEERRSENNKRRRMAMQQEQALKDIYLPTVSKGKDKAPLTADQNMPLMDTQGNVVEGYANLSNSDIVQNRAILTKANMANNEAAAQLKKLIDSKKTQVSAVQEQVDSEQMTPTDSSSMATSESEVETPAPEESKKRKFKEVDDANLDQDDVKLYEPGYHKRYYEIKFHCTSDEEIERTRREVVAHYVEGIAWVAMYYYQGCPSWTWYFPYHYAPFAADFTNLKELFPDGVKFDLGQPFRPFEQLMSVLPAASGHALPKVFRDLMSNPDSEIIDFYPEEFEIDMNGAKMSWQGIPLLPFIDEKRLLTAVQKQYDLLTPEEKDRNTNKKAELFISSTNKNYPKFCESLYKEDKEKVHFKSGKSGLAGTVIKLDAFKPEGIFKFPLNEGHMPDVDNKEYFQATYEFPKKKTGKSMILNGHIAAVPTLSIADKNDLIYQLDKFNNNRRNGPNGGGRFSSVQDNAGYVNKGPAGKEIFKMYSMRRGGYRSYLQYLANGKHPDNHHTPHPQQNQYQAPNTQRYNSGGYQGGYGNNRGYNSSYNNTSRFQGVPNNNSGGYQGAKRTGFLPPKPSI